MDKIELWHLACRCSTTARKHATGACRATATAWTNEADRRKDARKVTKPAVRDAQRALRAAKLADPTGERSGTHRAERELKKAKRAVPDPLGILAAKVAAATAVGATLGAPHVPARVWLVTAIAVAAAIVGYVTYLVVADLVQLHRTATELQPTAEERRLLDRLAPEHWAKHAQERGLADTITGRPVLGEAGITVAVRLDKGWTVTKLRAAEESVRALLGARTGLPMLVEHGESGGWARVQLRTRSAADGADFSWKPGTPWGVNTVTGEAVDVPLGQRMLIAGRSGAGKSWSARPLLHAASEGDHNRLVIIDLKWVEARNWEHRARTATTPDAVVALVDELVEEMTERLKDVPRGRDTIKVSAERPRITLFVDEGSEVVSAAKKSLAGLESIARMGRAACIDLWWATQKPTMSGSSPGIPAQIAPQLSTVVSLAVSSAQEARTVLGEDAQAKGWKAEELPAPGYALVRSGPGSRPDPIRTRALSPADVVALPDRPVWQRGEVATTAPAATEEAAGPIADPRVRFTLVKGGGEGGAAPAPVPAPRPAPATATTPAAPDSVDSRVWQAIQLLTPPVRQKDVVEASGVPKGSVSKAVKRLIESGHLVKHEDGTLTIKAGEVSA